VLQHIARDLAAAEDIVRATPLAWTIARPPRLNKSADESYHSAVNALPTGSKVMSFRAVAAFMLDAVERGTHIRDTVGLSK
jgi:hypothetical protein